MDKTANQGQMHSQLHRTLNSIAAGLLLMAGLAGVGLHQTAFAEALPADSQVALNLKDADIQTLIATVAEATGKNFVVDPRVKAKVTVISSRPMAQEELYEVFLSILQVHGFAVVETGQVIKIIPNADAKQLNIPTDTGTGRFEMDQLVTRIIPVKNVAASQLVPILRPLVDKEGHLAAYPATNTLIISDRASNVVRIDRLMHQIDRPIEDDVEIIPLQHAPAKDIARNLSSLITRTGDAGGQPPPKIVADDWTNSLLISGDHQTRLRLRALIPQLDTPRNAAASVTKVVHLHHAGAKEMAALLTNLAGKLVKADSSTGNQADTLSTGISIEADETIHVLVMSGPQATLNRLEEVIKELDIPRAQVLVEAIIAEVSSDKLAELGVQWQMDSDFTGNTGFGGTNFDASGVSIGTLRSSPLAQGNGLTLGLSNGTNSVLGTEFLDIRTVLNALAGDGRSNVLSTPSLVVRDNEEAEIVVGQNVPFVTGQYSGTSSGSVVDNPFQTIERKDVGLTLQVKPRITEGDAVKLDIQQEVSSVSTTTIAGAADLITNKRSIKTSVTVHDGNVLVLGGLMDDNLQENEQKVPGLGDIPLVGELFKSRKTSSTKRSLMVFIRPVILRGQPASEAVSRQRYEHMRQQQTEHSKDGVALMPSLQPPAMAPLDSEVQSRTPEAQQEPEEENLFEKYSNY